MKHRTSHDLASGATLFAIGSAAALYAPGNYDMGSVVRMGPGFVPFWIGLVVAGIGLLVIGRPLLVAGAEPDSPPPFHARPLAAITSAVLFFALTVEQIGLIPTAMIATFIASLAEEGFRLKRTALLSVVLAALIWVVFILLLKISLPAFNLPVI